LESDSSSEKDEVPLHSKVLGMIIPRGESSASPPPRLNRLGGFAEFGGGYESSTMVDRNASNISFFEFSSSGEVEKRSVIPVGVHAVEGSNDDATDSVILALDNRPVLIKLKSNVGAEFTLAPSVGVHVEGHDVGGETLVFEKIFRVSILGIGCAFRLGMALKLRSRKRKRFSWSLEFELVCSCC